jgi:hypothetical protein
MHSWKPRKKTEVISKFTWYLFQALIDKKNSEPSKQPKPVEPATVSNFDSVFKHLRQTGTYVQRNLSFYHSQQVRKYPTSLVGISESRIQMSEPIPESIPTSQDPRSKRPTKKRALTPVTAQAATIDALFAKPDKEIYIPSSGSLVPKPSYQPPQIVANVQGSSAGAGSGEFHVYKASRRREYERLRTMDEEVRKEKESEEFDRLKEEREERDREKTRKNREKREKMKARRGKGKSGAGGSGGGERRIERDDTIKDLKRSGVDHTGGHDIGENGEVIASVQEVGLIIHDDDRKASQPRAA